MEKMEIDITNKIITIECSTCIKSFIESFDNLKVKGSVKCPHCKKEYFINLKQ